MQTLAAMLFVAGICAPTGSGAIEAPSQEAPKRLEYQQILMGVPVRILVYASDESVANAAVHAAFDRIRQLNAIFSDYDETSEISRLCRTAGSNRPQPVSHELAYVLADSLALARRSDGAFDVTVGPLVQLWRKARREKRLPTAEILAAARARVGWQAVKLDRKRGTVELQTPGMRLDFGGIVKGYAADEARMVLQAHGLQRSLVALSGDISVGDPPPGQPGWKIAIQGIGTGDRPPDEFLSLKRAAVSTAGDAYQFVEIDGKRFSHLIDPKTGLGLTRPVSVTVIAAQGITADGLDSAAAILGPVAGMKLLESTPGVAARFVEMTAAGPKKWETANFSHYRLHSAQSHH